MEADDVLPITQEHASDVARLWSALFQDYARSGTFALLGPPAILAETITSWVALVVGDPAHIGYVVLRRGVAVGFIAGSVRDRPWMAAGRVGTIGAVWVNPDVRRSGLGRRLVSAALERFRELQVDALEAQMAPSLERQSFWKAMEFYATVTHVWREL